jgi:competence protein ComFC
MAIVKINPIKIVGRWQSGIALDLHTTSSTPIGHNEFGHMQFDTVRPEIAELLFRLKNRADKDAARPIIETAVNFLAPYRDRFDSIVPVPPSHQRALQPVIVLAEGMGVALGVPVLSCITTTRPTTRLKSVTDPEERKKQVDLFRSGTTVNAITDELLGTGKAAAVRVLTITKTRSNH